jgi:ectoine hydroxylase-related dioxygenase (phytanoyl-CoA dioxygenase family)
MAITHVPADTSANVIHEILAREGALVIDDLASASVIDAVAAEMETFVDATPNGSDDFSGRATRRTGALIARSPSSRELVSHPLILDVAGQLMHQASSIQVHLTQIISIGPDSPGQSIHRDEWAFDFFPFPSDVHPQCNTIWAMTDFTEENGATRVIPGSQEWPVYLKHSVGETVPVEMTKGSCLLYSGKVYHGGGANRSDAVRTGLNLTYCVAWLRQEENQYLSCPREVALGLDDELLKLMGYQIGAYALGYADDVRDPLDALRGETGSMGFGIAPNVASS